jgi:hypothetical protein
VSFRERKSFLWILPRNSSLGKGEKEEGREEMLGRMDGREGRAEGREKGKS